MKKLLLVIILVLSTNMLSSTQVNLNIDYNVDGKEFEINEEYTNTKGIKYKIGRLEYYMCGFELDGQPLDVYVLANGNYKNHPLGDYDIENVKKLTMSFGVKKEDNIDKDPNRFGPFHPLAPKEPSMHWGWAAGYRFWVVEGVVDSDNDGIYDKSFQYHVLGDEAFRTLTLDVNVASKEGVLNLDINFDVQKLLKGIDMSKFGAYHDFYNNIPELRDFINNIIPSGAITSKVTTSVESEYNNIEIYPNPTANHLNIGSEYMNSDYDIITINGVIAQSGVINSNRIELENQTAGTYLIRIRDSKGNINTAKFVKN